VVSTGEVAHQTQQLMGDFSFQKPVFSEKTGFYKALMGD
jgi:hypothetical protein